MAENVSLGNAYVTIIPSMRGFEREMNKRLSGIDLTRTGKKLGTSLGGSMATAVSDRLVHIGDSLTSAGSKLADMGGRLTAGITVPLVGATAAAGTFALRTASAAETTEISFTTMLGSEEAALSMMEELADFAAHTPFELSGLQTATRQLLAYGFTAEDVIPMLTAVGDATAALGTGQAGIESVTRALGQMQTRGKVSSEEMLQLTEQGIPAWEYLARAIGTDTAGAMQAVTDGAVSASQGIQAIVSGMENDFGGMMEEQSKTVEGLFSNLSDAIEQPLMKLRESDAYERFADSLEDVVDSAGPFVESLLPHMEKGLDAVSGVLDAATDAMDAFADMGEDGQSQLIGMATAAAAAGPALTVAGKGMQLLGSATKGAGSLIKAGQRAVGTLGDKLLDLATAPATASTAIGKLSGALSGAAGPIALVVGLVGTAAVAAFADWAAKEQEAAEHAALLSDATQSSSEIMSAAVGAANGLGDAIGGITTDAEGTLEALADLNASVAESLGETAVDSGRLDQYVSVIDELANKSGLTATEQYRLTEAVEGFNEVTGESYSVVDAANGKIADQNGALQENTDALHESADAWLQRAQAEAMSNVATQYLEQEAQAAYDLQVAQQNLADAQQRLTSLQSEQADVAARMTSITDQSSSEYQELSQRYAELGGQIQDATSAVSAQEQEVSDLTAAHETAAQSAQDFSNAAAIQSAVFDVLGERSQEFVADLSTMGFSLSDFAGLTDEQMDAIAGAWDGSVTSVIDAMNGLGIQVPNAAYEAMLGYNTNLSNGGAQAISTALRVSGLTAQQFADKVGEYGISGSQAITVFANAIAAGDTYEVAARKAQEAVNGIGSKEGAARAEGQQLASSANDGMSGVDTYTSGSHLGGNFASGIASAYDRVMGAAKSLASAAAKNLKFSVPKDGPWSGSERGGLTSGLHLGQNFASGMVASVPDVERASEALADAATVDASSTWNSQTMRARAPYVADGKGVTRKYDNADVVAAINALRGELSQMGVYLDSGLLVGGITPQMNRSLGRVQRRGSLA